MLPLILSEDEKKSLGEAILTIANNSAPIELKERVFSERIINKIVVWVVNSVRYLLGPVYNMQDAEDISQEVLLRFYVNAPTLRGLLEILEGKSFSRNVEVEAVNVTLSWLNRVIRNRVMDYKRRHPTKLHLNEKLMDSFAYVPEFIKSELTVPDFIYILKPHLKAAISRLKPSYQQIVKMKLSGMENQIIQQELETKSLKATKQIVYRAMKALRIQLRNELKRALQGKNLDPLYTNVIGILLNRLEQHGSK